MDFESVLKNHWGKILVGVAVAWFMFSFNGLNSAVNASKAAWSEVGSQYQRQSELLPNLVESVKGFANHESGAHKSVAELRAKVGQVNIDPTKLAGNVDAQQKLAQVGDEISTTVTRLLVVTERYPDLKANVNFLKLMDEVSGSANRIAVARRDAIRQDQDVNSRRGSLPWRPIMSSLFSEIPYYQPPAGSKTVPVIKF